MCSMQPAAHGWARRLSGGEHGGPGGQATLTNRAKQLQAQHTGRPLTSLSARSLSTWPLLRKMTNLYLPLKACSHLEGVALEGASWTSMHSVDVHKLHLHFTSY